MLDNEHHDLKKIMSEVEDEYDIPKGLLNTIYNFEKEVVHWAIRDKIFVKLRNVIEESSVNYVVKNKEENES